MRLQVIDELKKLDIKIAKKLFQEAKHQAIKRPPSPLQAKILKFLLENKNEVICQKDLENNFNVSKATISEVLLTMEKAKVIKRVSVPDDARVKRIILTNTSLERLEELEKNFQAINDELVADISDDELAQFINILNKMQDNMKKKGE